MVTKGFSEDVAFGCSEEFRLATVITLMKFDGKDFDWDDWAFKKMER
jgi:hypothetical protein